MTDKKEEKKDKEEKPTTGFRLNKTMIPIHYDLELWPRIYEGDDFGFDGNVTTQMMCGEDTNVIVLQVDTVTVHEDTILLKDAQGSIIKVNYTEQDVPRHFYKIYLEQKLMKNQNYSLYMRFNGTTIHDDLLGFYRSDYMENGTKHWVVSTQFEITHTRRCFPLFDENFFKATFTVTMVRRNDYISLGNMPIERTENRGGQWEADIYQKTVVMSPYLLAFSVNQFKYVESFTTRGTRMRIYTQPAMLPYAEYANSIAPKILEAFEAWTGIDYALPKLDQLVVPDFFFGAMENWGLVIYRETALLYNPKYSDINQRRIAAYVMAHELAHQWFGNLVTCRWWDDTFLNEAFATYFGYMVGLQAAEPEWEVDEFFMRVAHGILEQDGWHNSQPIRLQNLEHHDGLLDAFSGVTYRKGGALLRMTRDFLGASTFQKGLQRYLRQNAYKTATDDDLYQALQEQAEIDDSVTWDTQKANVSTILSSWLDQQNFPLVSVTDRGDGSLKVTQSHFLFEPDQNISHPTTLGSEFLWDIPLTYTDSSMQPGFAWMLREKESQVQGLAQNGWKMMNIDLVGFYRTRYSTENWNKIILQLLSNHTVFSVQNRAGFLDDAFYIAKAGEFPEVDALRATQYLRNERQYLPWYSGVRARIPYYLDMFFGKPVYDQLEKYLVDLVKPAYNASSWTVESDASNAFIDRYARIVILDTACKMNYKPCVDQAQAQFEQYINNPSNNPIHPDLRGIVYCTAIARGGVREWEFLRSRYEFDYGDVFLAYENSTVRDALACASTPNIIRKYLNYALKQNSTAMFSTIAKKRDARDTVWNYLTEHWDDFMDGNKTRITKSSLLTAVTSTWNTMGELRKFEDFTSLHEEIELTLTTYKTVKETIKDNMDWLDTNLEPIENWLTSFNKQQVSSPMQMQRRRKRSAAVDVLKDVGDIYGVHHNIPTA